MKRLEGRVALVTGAAGGIGRATVQRLAAEGAAVLMTDIEDDLGHQAAHQINQSGGTVQYAHQDVTSEPEWVAACQRVVSDLGRLDILVNNAGIADRGPIESTSLAEWERIVAIDQTSVFLGIKSAAPHLKQSPHACVINISSVFGVSGGFGTSPAYHAAKGAVRTLTKNVALHWATEGVRVNSIHPGFIATVSLERERGNPIWERMTALTPMGRLGRPEDVAAGVAYLASDDAAFVTGSELFIDGGYMAR